MSDAYPEDNFGRLAALTRSLTPDLRARIDSTPVVQHELRRALAAGFRRPVRAALRDHFGESADVDSIVAKLPPSWWFEPSKLRLVVTGFGPFLDNTRNPSWEVAQAFAETLSESFSTECERVAVTYADAAELAGRYDVADGQRLVVHFGLRASGADVAVERYAHNCRAPTRDESGRRDWPDMLVAGGPTAAETMLPVRSLADSLDHSLEAEAVATEHGLLGARMSRDVGDYVCNAIYYHSLLEVRAARKAGRAGEALFVHVPRLDEQAAFCAGACFGKLFKSYLVNRLLDA